MRTDATTPTRTAARLALMASLALSLCACGANGEPTAVEPEDMTPQETSIAAPSTEPATDNGSSSAVPTSGAAGHTETSTPSTEDAAESGEQDHDTEVGESAPTADRPLSAAEVSAETSEGDRTEALDGDGGIVLDGTTLTFVYVNGVQFSTDLGVPIGELPFNHTDSVHTVSLEADGSGMLVKGPEVTSINPDGSGTITGVGGTIDIAPDGSATCVTGGSISWVNADDTGGSAGSGGLLIIDGSDTVRIGTPPDPEDAVGRFTACNVEDTAKIDVSADVLFEFGQAELTDPGRAVIEDLGATITTNGATSLTVTGHTDWVGSNEFNLDLGQRRADAVAALLTQMTPNVEISTDTAGESRPVASNATSDGSDNPSGRTQNRRVEITFATQ